MLTVRTTHKFLTLNESRTILHCNVRSIARNFDGLCTFLAEHSFLYDVIAITETWLMPGESYNIPNYVFLSRPRISNNRGGGVGLYIKKTLVHCDYPYLNASVSSSSEFLFVELEGVMVGVVYRAPHADRSKFVNDLESVFIHVTDKNKKSNHRRRY